MRQKRLLGVARIGGKHVTWEELQSAIQDFWDEAFHCSKHKISDTSKAIALECMMDAAGHKRTCPSTNADRIREMSDKEISVLLSAVKFRRECFIKIPDFLSIQDAYKWLQQPAEEAR